VTAPLRRRSVSPSDGGADPRRGMEPGIHPEIKALFLNGQTGLIRRMRRRAPVGETSSRPDGHRSPVFAVGPARIWARKTYIRPRSRAGRGRTSFAIRIQRSIEIAGRPGRGGSRAASTVISVPRAATASWNGRRSLTGWSGGKPTLNNAPPARPVDFRQLTAHRERPTTGIGLFPGIRNQKDRSPALCAVSWMDYRKISIDLLTINVDI
jgi:hypothetical protein